MESNSPSDSSPKTDYDWLQKRYTATKLMSLTRLSRYHCNRILAGVARMPARVAAVISRDAGLPNCALAHMTELYTATLDASALHDLMDVATTHASIVTFCGAARITVNQYNNARYHHDRGIALHTALLLARHFGVPVESLIKLEG